jgi:hypothetical protein
MMESKYARASQKWTPEEDQKLLSLHQAQKPFEQIAAELRRTNHGVLSRYRILIGKKLKASAK